MLTHYLTRRRLGAYLDGALDEGTSRSTAAHLAGCGACQREADGLRRLRGLLQRNLAATAEPDWTGFWPGVVRGIEASRTMQPVRAARRPWWRAEWAVGGLVAATLLLTVGVWQFYPAGSQDGVIVRSASTDDPGATVMVYGSPERDVAVVWVLGLDEK